MQRKLPIVVQIFSLIAVAWTVLMFLIVASAVRWEKQKVQGLTHETAQSFFKTIVTTRAWSAGHGGVYVPVTKDTQPNKYLDVKERDITTADGRKLTLINPAYMTRQIAEIADKEDHVKFHITSLNPIRPENAPDAWEKAALAKLSRKQPEMCEWEKDSDGQSVYKYMAPLWTKQSCLQCHAKQGYKLGDMRGGISVTIPGESILESMNQVIVNLIILFLSIWILGLGGIIFAGRVIYNNILKQIELSDELNKSKTRIKELTGLIPICSCCKKVRDDEGFWQQVDEYITIHTEAGFSHGLCPECVKKMYPDYVRDMEEKKQPENSDSQDQN